MEIKEAARKDLAALLALYTHLHDEPPPPPGPALDAVWEDILTDPHHHLLMGWLGGELISSCVMVVVPNLTRGLRPYAVVENVVTHPAHRGRGHATRLLRAAQDLARGAGCYKIMLSTSSRQESTFRFYERAGFNRQDKTAFVCWLP